MKIAIVSDAIYPFNKGGKEKRIFEVSTRLAKKGHNVTIYTMHWWKGKDNHKIENGVTLHAISPLYPLYSGQRRSIKEAVMFAICCFKLVNKDFDVIDADHMPHLVLFLIKIVTILKRKKLFVTWNEVWGRKYWVEYMGSLGNLAGIIEKLSSFTPSEIISVSTHTANKFKKELNKNKKITVIPNGINFTQIQRIKPSKTKSDLIFAGRLLKHKNVDLLIKSVKLLVKKNPKIKCIIVGQGPEKENLIEQVAKLNLNKNILFLDFLPDYKNLYALFKSSKIFVFPSIREGFGITALEALSCGIPVITVKHKDNATTDLINISNGILVKPNEKDIAIGIRKLLNKGLNPKDCINFAKGFDWENIAEQTLELYSPKKESIVTTSWDDGHILDLRLAKLLKKYNLSGTFYISPKNPEFPEAKLLTKDQILSLSKDFEIGAHTMTHPHLTGIKHNQAHDEILESKKYLEKITKKKITAFCYPYGDFDKKTKKIVKDLGFKLARIVKRFETEMPKDYFELPTTTQAYTHIQDFLNFKLLLKFKKITWEDLAKKEFDGVMKHGGVFHLWGHSWEINKYKDWEKLEEVFKYISNKKDFKYLTNSEIINEK